MKWIGQHIWDFITRFRSDVYLEATETGTIASGGNLGLDANNKIVKADTEAGELSFNGNTTNGVLTYGGTSTIDVESTFTFNGSAGNLAISSSTESQPSINLLNSNDDDEGPIFNFNKTAVGADNDELGQIGWVGEDEGGGSHTFAQIVGNIQDATPGEEAGELLLKVAEFDGTLTSGLKLDGDTNANGEVDVTIGAGAASTTTIAGTLTMGTTAAMTNVGQLSVAAQPNITTMTGFLGGTANAIITDDGDGTVTSESTLTYTNEKLSAGNDDDGEFTIERLGHQDGDGGKLEIKAGSATNGQFNKTGGDLDLYGGLSTGAASGGGIKFYSHKRGSSGPTIGTAANIASIQPGTSNTDFIIYEDAGASTDDYYRVRVKANGETLITTNDDALTAAHYKVDADGDITLDAASGNIYLKDNGGNYTPGSDYEAATKKYVDDQSGWHGSSSTIKILPRDFVANDVGRPLMIEDDSVGSNELFLCSFSTSDAFAYVPIPTGFKATAVRLYGSDAGQDFYVYKGDINSKTITDVATGATSINTEKTLDTEVTSDATNYLIVRVTSDGVTDEIHGGRVTIVAV